LDVVDRMALGQVVWPELQGTPPSVISGLFKKLRTSIRQGQSGEK